MLKSLSKTMRNLLIHDFQQLLSQEVSNYGSVHSSSLPELPIPVLDNNATKVLVGHKPQHNQGNPGHHLDSM